MIVEFLKKPRDGKSSFRRAARYAIFGPESDQVDPETRVLCTVTRNLESSPRDLNGKYDPDDIIEEMISTARRNKNVAVKKCDPVIHVVLSWPKGEVPSKEQFEQAVEIFAKELEIENCQIFGAVHKDTEHLHLDLVINRVILDDKLKDLKLAPMHFRYKAGERAARKIEIAQGWHIEKRGHLAKLIEVKNERGEVTGLRVREKNEEPKLKEEEKTDRRISQTARAVETRTGLMSAERIAKEIAAPILYDAASWEEAHEKLAARGIEIQPHGSGGVLIVRLKPEDEKGTAVKLSVAGRQLAFKKLVEKFGVFVPRDQEVKTAEVKPRLAVKTEKEYDIVKKYQADKAFFEKNFADAQAKFIEMESRERDIQRAAMSARHAKELKELRDRVAAKRIREEETAKFEADLLRKQERQRQQLEKEILDQCRRAWKKKKPRKKFPSIKDWCREHGYDYDAEIWRCRLSIWQVNFISGTNAIELQTRDQIHVFKPTVAREGDKKIWKYRSEKGVTAFQDFGNSIHVLTSENREAVRAALMLAAKKWGAVEINGTPEFVQLTLEIAAEENITMRNPDLQQQVAEIRERMMADGRISIADDPELTIENLRARIRSEAELEGISEETGRERSDDFERDENRERPSGQDQETGRKGMGARRTSPGVRSKSTRKSDDRGLGW